MNANWEALLDAKQLWYEPLCALEVIQCKQLFQQQAVLIRLQTCSFPLMQCSLYEEVKCFRVGKTRIFVMDISCSYKGRVNRAEFVKKKKKKKHYTSSGKVACINSLWSITLKYASRTWADLFSRCLSVKISHKLMHCYFAFVQGWLQCGMRKSRAALGGAFIIILNSRNHIFHN